MKLRKFSRRLTQRRDENNPPNRKKVNSFNTSLKSITRNNIRKNSQAQDNLNDLINKFNTGKMDLDASLESPKRNSNYFSSSDSENEISEGKSIYNHKNIF